LRDGVRAYYNRGYTFFDVPQAMKGMQFLRSGMAAPDPVKAHVKSDGFLYATLLDIHAPIN